MAEPLRILRLLMAPLLCVGLVVAVVVHSQRLPDGPQPVAWDRQSCAHCQMHVGDPAFAAQLHTRQGEVLHFDDPGCLLLYRHDRRPDVHAVWFRHRSEDRWLSAEEVAFAPAPDTPMGFGIAAVDRGTEGAIPMEQALARLLREREASGGLAGSGAGERRRRSGMRRAARKRGEAR